MRKSAIEALSRVCAILPARRLAAATALLSLICSLFPVPCSLLYADSSVWNAVEAGHLTWSNATTNWVDGEGVITYKTGTGSPIRGKEAR